MTGRVFVPRDAAAIACGAEAVVAALAAAGFPPTRTSSRGMFWLEPLVEVEHDGRRYGFGPLDAAGAKALAEALAAGTPAAEIAHPQAVGAVEAIPFLARQTRLTFARAGITDPLSLADYEAHGGWAGLRRALALGPEAIVAEVAASGLRGRGGAGFPTGIKWKTVAEAEGPQKYIVCNADEGDSGTFADRMVMEGDPFLLIEGMTIAGLAVGATRGYLYVRSEYPHAIAALEAAIAAAEAAGWLGPRVGGSAHAFRLEVREGAGAYVCGEETALLDSLEGKRGIVRAKPPLPAHKGLFGRPTVINNVLSLAAVPFILAEGAKAYADYGMGRSRGTMPIQLAGNIRHGGLFETAFGISLGDLVDDIGGGSHSGRPVRAVQVGRPPRRLLPAGALRHALRLRGLRRPRRPDRPRRHRRLRRHRRHGETGPLRLRLLRHRELRQVHPLPYRRRPRPRDHGPHPRRRGHRRPGGAGRGPLPHDEIRIALCFGRFHPISCPECARAFPRGLPGRQGRAKGRIAAE